MRSTLRARMFSVFVLVLAALPGLLNAPLVRAEPPYAPTATSFPARPGMVLSAGTGVGYATYSQKDFPAAFQQLTLQAYAGMSFIPLVSSWDLSADFRGDLWAPMSRFSVDQGYAETVRTFNMSGELGYSPIFVRWLRTRLFLGGWGMAMSVQSESFGVQQALAPMVGLSLASTLLAKTSFALTARWAPLQEKGWLQLDPRQSLYSGDFVVTQHVSPDLRFFGLLRVELMEYVPVGWPKGFRSRSLSLNFGFSFPVGPRMPR